MQFVENTVESRSFRIERNGIAKRRDECFRVHRQMRTVEILGRNETNILARPFLETLNPVPA